MQLKDWCTADRVSIRFYRSVIVLTMLCLANWPASAWADGRSGSDEDELVFSVFHGPATVVLADLTPLPLPTPPVTAPGRARVDRRLSLLAFPGERGRFTPPTTSPGCGSACIATFNLPSTPRLQHASTDLSESAAQTKAAYTSYSQRTQIYRR